MIREIVFWPDPRLRAFCAPVTTITDDLRVLTEEMLETMYAAPGRGLAAPQVGKTLRIFVMDAGWKDGQPEPLIAINPEVVAQSQPTVLIEEACLSIPGVTATIRRPEAITLRWTDLEGSSQTQDLEGAKARIALHEIDHLDGLVIFDRLEADDRAALEAQYRGAIT